jgi:hypothetical protein
MRSLCCTAQFVALLGLAGVLSACGSVELFGRYDLPESPEVAAAPYPRLIDTPDAPPQGAYTDAVPDPATGTQTLSDLTSQQVVADVRATETSRPVISDEEEEAIFKRVERARALADRREAKAAQTN